MILQGIQLLPVVHYPFDHHSHCVKEVPKNIILSILQMKTWSLKETMGLDSIILNGAIHLLSKLLLNDIICKLVTQSNKELKK